MSANVAGFGGAINAEAFCAVDLLFCLIANNTANFAGGGIRVFELGHLAIYGSLFRSKQTLFILKLFCTTLCFLCLVNEAKNGGGVALELYSEGEIVDSYIEQNQAHGCGGGVVLYGNSEVKISNTDFFGKKHKSLKNFLFALLLFWTYFNIGML